MKKLLFFIIIMLLSGCTNTNKDVLRIGTSPGLNAEILENVKSAAKKEGFDFEIVPFKDYSKMNVALKQGDIDANCFQNAFYLKKTNAQEGGLISAFACYLKPLAMYSAKYKSIGQLPKEANIYIADDPITMMRSLLLLEKTGLVKIKSDAKEPALSDIEHTYLKIIAVDSSKIRNFYSSCDAIILSFDYASSIDLKPENSLLPEDLPSDFTQLIVTTKEKKDIDKIKKFINFYKQPTTKNFLREKFGNNIIIAF